jgi:hypothetical protein
VKAKENALKNAMAGVEDDSDDSDEEDDFIPISVSTLPSCLFIT